MGALDDYMKRALSYWSGAFSFIPDDMADGAWFQTHVDTAEYHLTEPFVKEGLEAMDLMPPPGTDPHDLVVAYFNCLEVDDGADHNMGQ